MELNKGLWKDSRHNKTPQGTWVEARNILISKGFRSIVNEDGFSIVDDSLGTILGVIPCQDFFILLTKNSNGDKIMKLFPDGDLGTVVDDVGSTFLKFDFSYPIEGIFKVNNQGETIICWTDFNQDIRTLNVDNVPILLDADSISLYPRVQTDLVYDLEIEDNTGNLQVGNYVFTAKLITEQGMSTPWLATTKPVFITDDALSVGYNNYDGSPFTVTSKSIVVNLTGIDTRFEKIQIGVISTLNSIKSFQVIFEETISGTTLTRKYTGSELIDNNIEVFNVLSNNIFYTKCKTLTQLDGNLFIGNLKNDLNFNYQKWANNIKINYVTENKNVTSLSAGSATGSSKIIQLNHKDRSFNHREVYAFYVGLKLRRGGYSQLFHIPGRRAVAGETANSALGITGFTTMPKVYEIQDTADAVGATTNMGYWENKNETYPTLSDDINGDFEVWDITGKIDDIQGENVRHHRFPSIKHIKDLGIYGANYRKTDADILGIEITDVYIPDEIKAEVIGWEIFYAERSYNDCTVLGQDFMVTGGSSASGVTRYNRGVNYSFNEPFFPNPSSYIQENPNYIQCRCADLLKDKPAASPQYIAFELDYILTTTRLRSVISGGAYLFENLSIDYTGMYSVADTVNITSWLSTNIRSLLNSRYVAANATDGDIDNRLGDEYLELELDPAISLSLDNNYFNLTGTNTFPQHESVLYSIMQLKDDIYNRFNNYDRFVSTGVTFDKNDTGSTSNVFGGDIFISDYCSVRYGVGKSDIFNTSDNHENLHHFIRGIINSVNNWSLRHLEEGNEYSYYYPKKSNWLPASGYGELDKNIPLEILYNKDFTAIDNTKVVFPFNFSLENTYLFPFRIARATSISEETNEVSWGEFLANNYYDMPRHKGEIWKLDVLHKILLINQKSTFSVARDKDKLSFTTEEIYLGTGDVFDRAPDENIPTPYGYAGCQSQWGTVVCKHGYVFIDAQQGKVFLYNGSLTELSNKGMYDDFRKLLPYEGNIDNPFTSNGITCVFEEEYNRLIVSKRHFVPSIIPLTLDTGVTYDIGDIISDGVNFYLVVDTKILDNEFYYPEDLLANDGGGGTITAYGEIISFNNPNYFTDNSITLSYSFDYNCWVCNHDYTPNYMFYNRSGSYAIENNVFGKVFKISGLKNSKGLYFDRVTPYRSFISVPFVFPKPVTLASVKWKSDMFHVNDNIFIEDETLTHLTIYNKNQCSGKIVLTSLVPTRSSKTLFRNTEGIWSCNNFRDLVAVKTNPFLDNKGEVINSNISTTKPFYSKTLFKSDYFVVTFEINNLPLGSWKELYLNDVDVLVQESNKDY